MHPREFYWLLDAWQPNHFGKLTRTEVEELWDEWQALKASQGG